MTDFQISFFDCARTLREAGISVTSGDATAYTYVERIGRALKRWITVTAKWLRRVFRRTCQTCRTCRTRLTGRTFVLSFAGGLRL